LKNGIKGWFFDLILSIFLALKNAVGSSLQAPPKLLLSCSTEELRGWVE
jgi:hypothetical protein